MTEETDTPETPESNPFENAESFQAALAAINDAPEEGEEPKEGADSPAPEENNQEETPAQEEDDDYGFIETDKGKMIPKGRFSKEIEKRRAIEAQLQQEREARIRYEQDLNNMKEALALYYKEEEPQSKEPDELDPIDPETTTALLRRIKALEEEAVKSKQTQEQKETQGEYQATLSRQQSEFTKENPDFDDAYKFLKQRKYEEYREVGYSDDDAKQAALQDLAHKARLAYEKNKNVAQLTYSLAKKLGYSTKPKGADLDKIEANMRKSSSINSVPNVSGKPFDSSGTVRDNIKALADERGAIDPAKFRAMLSRVESQNVV